MKLKEPWLWLQDDEHSAEADDCACVLHPSGPEGEGDAAFYICPLHEFAAELLALVKRARDAAELLLSAEDWSAVNDARKFTDELTEAIRRAEGVVK